MMLVVKLILFVEFKIVLINIFCLIWFEVKII